MSIYEDGAKAPEPEGGLVVPDYDTGAKADLTMSSDGGGGGGKDYAVTTNKSSKNILIGVLAIGLILYVANDQLAGGPTPTGNSQQYTTQQSSGGYQPPPPPPPWRAPPPPPPIYRAPPPPPPVYYPPPAPPIVYQPPPSPPTFLNGATYQGGGVRGATGLPGGTHGRFIAVATPMHWDDARSYCEQNHGGLASIHSKEEQLDADNACREMPLSLTWADENNGMPHGCWIGMYEDHARGGFVWSDQSVVSYLNFHAGEPNNDARIDESGHEEDKVELNFAGWGGAWNDNHAEGAAGFHRHASSCSDGHCATNAEGMFPLCQVSPSVGGGITGVGGTRAPPVFVPPTKVTVGRFTALPAAYDMEAADQQCKAQGYAGLASIHSADEQMQAAQACDQLVQKEEESGVPHGCWIGYKRAGPTIWAWKDGTKVDYQNWSPGEPNDYRGGEGTHSNTYGEEASEMDFRSTVTDPSGRASRGGGWNDNSVNGQAGHTADHAEAWGTLAVFGMFPLCQQYVPDTSQSAGSMVGIMGLEPVRQGRFLAVQQATDYDGAEEICRAHQAIGLASIHSAQEQLDAATACSQIVGTDLNSGTPKGCWLGLQRDGSRSRFVWDDGSSMDFVNWAPGEPNDYRADSGAYSTTNGEEVVEMDFRADGSRGGGWNDQNKMGEAGHSSFNGADGSGYFGTGGTFGAYVLCETSRATSTNAVHNAQTGIHSQGFEVKPPVTSPDNKYTAYQYSMNWDDAQAYCISHQHAGLASIHSVSDQESASYACRGIISDTDDTGVPHGCWLGFTQRGTMGTWTWNDGSPVTYVNWAPGEPNDYRAEGAASAGVGEEVAEMAFRSDFGHGFSGGGWNDNHVDGQAGHGQSVSLFGSSVSTTSGTQSCFGCSGTFGMYILCENQLPSGLTGGTQSYTRHDQTNANVESNKYVASPSPTHYDDAQLYCQSQGMNLASIHSSEDQREAYEACRQLHHPGVSGEPSGCWIGLNSKDISGGNNHGQFSWTDHTAVDYIDWSPGEPNDWGAQSNQGAASTEGEDSVELNIDRSGAWNDQHAMGDAAHDQQENRQTHQSLFGAPVPPPGGQQQQSQHCFGCTGTYGMWPLCERQIPRPSNNGNVFDPMSHQLSRSPTWSVPGTDINTGNLNYANNDYFGNGNQQIGQSVLPCISSKSCSQLRSEHGGWPAEQGDSMVCGESDTIGISETLFGTTVNGDTRGSCTGGMNSAANGMSAGGNDVQGQGWAHANQMCQQAGARMCTVREMLLDVTAGTGCQHDGELVWTSEGCKPDPLTGGFAVTTSFEQPIYHIVAQGGTNRGKEACPDQCGGIPDGVRCVCTPRCASDTHNANGNSFAHRCCADVSPQQLNQQLGGSCNNVQGYTGQLMAPPTLYGAQAACAGGATLFGATTGCPPPGPPPYNNQNPFIQNGR